MTKSEINNILEIPISTLNDWDKSNHSKNKLYKFLVNSTKEDAIKQTSRNQYHRIYHILNRNIDSKYNYGFDDIVSAFTKTNYTQATQRDKKVYSSFFKECDIDDLASLEVVFNVSKRTIKQLYITLPQRNINGVAKVWDRKFRLKRLPKQEQTTTSIPTALEQILNNRVA